MPNINLTQNDLNESLRGFTYTDILMFLPDKNVIFPSNAVTMNQQPLAYTSNLQSLLEFSKAPLLNLATFENNSWILDGSFLSPSESYGGGGDSYAGYISNDYTDNNGNYAVNPIITVTLAAVVPKLEYLSIKFAGGVDTSYPKTFKIRTYDDNNSLVREHSYNMSEQTKLPLLVEELQDQNVKKVEFEFVGTQCPHRRSRLSKILFGKAEQVDPHYLQSWKIDDKASLVADSIPTKTLSYSIINYDGEFNVDNPENNIPSNFSDINVLFTFSMEKDGLWKYTPTKVFNLMNVSTTPEGIATFDCGSVLDILTETYDRDIYYGVRTIDAIMRDLLTFSGLGTDQVIYEDVTNFKNYQVNIPIPEAPVREIIQRLAFSCGAALLTNDDNKIVFAKRSITTSSATPKFMFNQPNPFNSAGVLLEEPNAEALNNTTNIAMVTYESVGIQEYDEHNNPIDSELGTTKVSTINPTRISFSAAEGVARIDRQQIEDQGASVVRVDETYSQHMVITLNWPDTVVGPIEVKVYGKKVETTQSSPKTADKDTLILDSGVAQSKPDNIVRPGQNPDETTFYYTDWYGAKFKYMCKTRNEYLIKAGDIILFETPFSNGEANRIGYVLRNSFSETEDSGEMEVITIGSN